MAYQKLLVDNSTCSRRFHITFDDADVAVPQAQLNCPYCGVTIFSKPNHPDVRLARQENLVKTAELSDDIIRECKFGDVFPPSSRA